MYNIGIPEIIISDRLEDDKGISIKYLAEAAKRPVCPNLDCSHSTMPNRHDSTSYLLHDVKSEGKLVYIDLKMRRYKCPECQSVFPDVFTFFTKKQHMTHRLKNEFVSRCIKGEPFHYIANDYSVDPKTVAAAFQEYVDAHKEELNYQYTPEILGIDEAHIDDHYRLVLTDIKGQKLLDMKPDNKPRTVKAFLSSLDSSICKCVAMDFAPEYASAVSETLPDAAIVIDKFHAVQDVNKCLDNVRKRIQKEYLAKGYNIRRFKHSRYLFMTNLEDLSSDGASRLSDWFNEIPEFYEAYMCKELFRDIYNYATTKEKAIEMFDKWLSSIPSFPEFAPMKTTMTRRRDHILNYWDYKWTNAYTESVNNAIKAIEKRGRGYKFARLRELCILEINKAKSEKFDPKTAAYTSVSVRQDIRRRKFYTNCIAKKNETSQSKSSHATTDWIINGTVIELFDVYTSLEHNKDFILRMAAYRNTLLEKGFIS